MPILPVYLKKIEPLRGSSIDVLKVPRRLLRDTFFITIATVFNIFPETLASNHDLIPLNISGHTGLLNIFLGLEAKLKLHIETRVRLSTRQVLKRLEAVPSKPPITLGIIYQVEDEDVGISEKRHMLRKIGKMKNRAESMERGFVGR